MASSSIFSEIRSLGGVSLLGLISSFCRPAWIRLGSPKLSGQSPRVWSVAYPTRQKACRISARKAY
jgi:hypothetical protein